MEPNACFTTALRFDNLSGYELGALLYLLTMGNERTLKVGMGKPLGFGSITLVADLDAAQVLDGQAVRARYQLAAATSATPEQLLELVDQFQTRTRADNPQLLADFEAATAGFRGEVHYPWTTPTPQPTATSGSWPTRGPAPTTREPSCSFRRSAGQGCPAARSGGSNSRRTARAAAGAGFAVAGGNAGAEGAGCARTSRRPPL